MRICILGRSNYILLQERVKNLVNLSHDVHVVTIGKRNEDLQNSGATIHHVNVPLELGALRYLQALPKIRQLLMQLQPDAIDVHGLSSYGAYGLLPLNSIPFVATMYGPDVNVHGRNSRLLAMIIRRCLHKADLVYGSTPTAHEYIKDVLKIDIRKKFISRSWGIDIKGIDDAKSERRTQIRSEYGISNNTKVILHNRHFAHYSRVQNIVECIPRVLSCHPDTEFWFVYPPLNQEGQRTLQEAQDRVVQLGTQKAVRFLGAQPYDRMISIMHASDVYLCIVESDLLASSILEALATDLIPVLNDLQAYHEVIEHGSNGLLLESVEVDKVARTLIEVLKNFDRWQPSFAEKNKKLIKKNYDSYSNTAWLAEQFATLSDKDKSALARL
ncbi:MAG: glycosyltransferase family 4 protein [Chloroflexota bacterium]